MARKHRYLLSGLFGLSFVTLLAIAFWPRPLSPMAMTYRAPLFWMADRGEKIELQTVTQLELDREASVPISNALWIGGRTKDLAVLVSGLVGRPESSLNIYMAQDFVAAGASVLILPSPTEWSFALRRLTKDQRSNYEASVEALCTAIEEVLDSSQARASLGDSSLNRVYLVGLSLGARHSISLTGCFRKIVPAKEVRVLAVNPPTDLLYAGTKIDQLSAGLAANRPRGYAVGILMRTLRPFVPWLGVDRALRPLSYFPEALEQLAGGSFAARMEQVQTGQVTQLDGITTRRSDFTFLDFMKHGPNTVEDFRRETVLARQLTKGHVYALHARDDFLIRPQDLNFLAVELQGKARLLETGGHGGLVFEPVYREMVAHVISDP
jgi:hypothetical protein